MVSETVIETPVEQVTDDAPQVEDVALDELETASPETDTPDVDGSDSPDAVLEDATETELTLDDPRIAAALEERLKVERNAGAQSRESALRKELGNDANQAARLQVYADTIAEHGANPAALKAITQDRDLYARDNYNRTAGKSVLEFVKATPEQVDRYIGKLDSLSGDGLTAVTNELIVDMTAAIKADVSTTLTLADVPEDSPLRTEITAEAARLVAEELTAQGIEAKGKRDPAPNVPAGGVPAPGATNPLLEKLENQGRNALSADELKEVNRLLGY